MAREMVETLVDDLDGSAATETIWLGWNGDWREIDLWNRNRGLAQGIDVPAQGRAPAEVERQYHEANGDSSRR